MEKLVLKYYNPVLKIALGKWNQAYLISANNGKHINLLPEYYKGYLVYRIRGSSKRISYKQLKTHLFLKRTIIIIEDFKMPF